MKMKTFKSILVSNRGQTALEYALMVSIFIVIALAFNKSFVDEPALDNRNVMQLMHDSIEMTITRSYP